MDTGKRPGLRAGFLLLGALLLGLDQITKYYVFTLLKPRGPVVLIPGFLEFTYVENRAAAMGLFAGMINLVVCATLVICVAIVVLMWRYKQHTVFSLLTCALLLSGGIGNLMDRFQWGFVVDFIHVIPFPYVFNVADCCITVGAMCLVVHVMLTSRREKEQASKAPPKEEP